MKIEPMDDMTVEGIIQKAVQDAVDFIEAEIEEPRIRSQRYYDGEVDIGYEDGRSRVVATKCREVVKSLKPSIQRIFLSTDKVVEFVPRMPEDVKMCEQMTEYANYKFMQNDGYRLLNDVFQDAMVKKTGIAKVMFEEKFKSEIYTVTNLSDDEYNFLVEPDDIEVLEHSETQTIDFDAEGVEIAGVSHDATIKKNIPDGDISIMSIPPLVIERIQLLEIYLLWVTTMKIYTALKEAWQRFKQKQNLNEETMQLMTMMTKVPTQQVKK